MIIQADDKIELITEKTRTDGTGGKIGLSENWRDETDVVHDENGKEVIYSYWNGEKYISPDVYKALSYEDSLSFLPCKERIFRPHTIPHSSIRFRGNSIYLHIGKMSFQSEEMLFSSRYRKLLETFHEARPNVFEYSTKGGNRPIEASRRKLLNWFRLYEYEYDILIMDKELGRKVFEEMRPSARKIYETTLYLKGAGEKQGKTVKMYLLQEGFYKIEITFRKDTFKKLGLDIRKMTHQENCIEYLRHEAIGEIMKLKGGEAVEQLQLNFVTENNILARIVKLENDSQRTEQRFAGIENDRQRTEQRFAGIENELKELRRALVKQRTKTTRKR